jgi:hypothetical protein
MKRLHVLVPRSDSRAGLTIDPGSGIVTALQPPSGLRRQRIEVYFEGNRYGAENMRRFEERVLHAAGRLDKHYPTIARGVFLADEFVVVGTFTFAEDWRTHQLTITDPATLETWAPGANEERTHAPS